MTKESEGTLSVGEASGSDSWGIMRGAFSICDASVSNSETGDGAIAAGVETQIFVERYHVVCGELGRVELYIFVNARERGRYGWLRLGGLNCFRDTFFTIGALTTFSAGDSTI